VLHGRLASIVAGAGDVLLYIVCKACAGRRKERSRKSDIGASGQVGSSCVSAVVRYCAWLIEE